MVNTNWLRIGHLVKCKVSINDIAVYTVLDVSKS